METRCEYGLKTYCYPCLGSNHRIKVPKIVQLPLKSTDEGFSSFLSYVKALSI